MSIYDKAHDLAKALKESSEVEEITAAMKLVDADRSQAHAGRVQTTPDGRAADDEVEDAAARRD